LTVERTSWQRARDGFSEDYHAIVGGHIFAVCDSHRSGPDIQASLPRL
jgi:hypothetical protein